MINLIIQAILFILVAVGILFIAWLASFIASLFNLKISDLRFDKKRLWNGVYKLVAITLVAVLLAILFTLIPIVCTYFGAEIPEEYTKVLNVMAIVIAFLKASVYYTTQAYDKLVKLINGGFIEEDDPIDTTQE